MKRISIASIPYQPGTSHTDSIEFSAEDMLRLGAIKAIPEITIEPCEPPFPSWWKIIVNCLEEDAPAWIAFSRGITFSRNNKELFLGGSPREKISHATRYMLTLYEGSQTEAFKEKGIDPEGFQKGIESSFLALKYNGIIKDFNLVELKVSIEY